MTVPAGNTYNISYNLYDSYLGGSDNGPGFYNASAKIVGVSGQTVYEGLRYVSGQAWDGYMSAYLFDDVVFGNGANAGPGLGQPGQQHRHRSRKRQRFRHQLGLRRRGRRHDGSERLHLRRGHRADGGTRRPWPGR